MPLRSTGAVVMGPFSPRSGRRSPTRGPWPDRWVGRPISGHSGHPAYQIVGRSRLRSPCCAGARRSAGSASGNPGPGNKGHRYQCCEHLRTKTQDKNLLQKGFTLVELLVVIVILGILAAVVVFAVGGSEEDANLKACLAERNTVEAAVEAYKAQVGSYPPSAAAMISGTGDGNKGKVLVARRPTGPPRAGPSAGPTSPRSMRRSADRPLSCNDPAQPTRSVAICLAHA